LTETLNRIREIINTEAAVSEVQWVTGRNTGRYGFVEAGVVLRATQSHTLGEAMLSAT
jgi:hypothetical protein